jgi:hypothetical protein
LELERNGNYIYLNTDYIYVHPYLANSSVYKLWFIRGLEIHTLFFNFSLLFYSVSSLNSNWNFRFKMILNKFQTKVTDGSGKRSSLIGYLSAVFQWRQRWTTENSFSKYVATVHTKDTNSVWFVTKIVSKWRSFAGANKFSIYLGTSS